MPCIHDVSMLVRCERCEWEREAEGKLLEEQIRIDQTCQRCGEGPDQDLRTLRMACLYNMEELGLPFRREDNHVYTLRVCKTCRGLWMSAIKNWFEWIDTRERRSPGTGIFIRRNGANVEVTEEEFREMAAKKEIE